MGFCSSPSVQIRVSEFSGLEWWNGMVEWTGMVEWYGGMHWNSGMEGWWVPAQCPRTLEAAPQCFPLHHCCTAPNNV